MLSTSLCILSIHFNLPHIQQMCIIYIYLITLNQIIIIVTNYFKICCSSTKLYTEPRAPRTHSLLCVSCPSDHQGRANQGAFLPSSPPRAHFDRECQEASKRKPNQTNVVAFLSLAQAPRLARNKTANRQMSQLQQATI